MSIMEHWRLAITPLSPVHMGTGQDYSPTDYVIQDDALYEFDAISALRALPEPERRQLDQILNSRPNEQMLLAVQDFFYRKRERLIAVSRRQVRVNPEIEAFYQERVGQVAQREATGAAVQNRLEIERTAWSPGTGDTILPGSGLKGAIRTALLDTVNAGRPLSKDLKSDRHANRKLQESLFGGSFDRDPLRMLRFADAGVVDTHDMATEVRFALNRKKRPVMRQGQAVRSQAEQKGLYQLLECLPPFVARGFEGSLSIQGTGGVENSSWPSRCFSLPEIVAACNRFYRAHLERETGLMRSMGYLDGEWAARIERLVSSGVGQALNENRAFLLRVGRHSGAESVSLNGVRNIRIMKGRGEPAEFLSEAKTLWLAGRERDSQRDLLPFGWILVEPFQDPTELPSWPEDLRDRDVGSWRSRASTLREDAAARLEEQQKQDAERIRAAEAVERERREREERLQSMSAEERQIEALRATLVREQEAGLLSPNSQVSSDRVALLRAALEWDSDELRSQAADAIEETVRALAWSKKSKADRQTDLARLRQMKA